jgi:DNA-directed RNA polymerase specialized sigma24 family protein
MSQNPILDRILKEEKAVKRIIANTILTRNIKQSSYLDIDDIYQDILEYTLDYDRASKRFKDIDKYFYGSIKMLTIDFILKEQRRLHRFHMSAIGHTTKDKSGNRKSIVGYEHHKRLSHPTFTHISDTMMSIKMTLKNSDYQIFKLYLQGYTMQEIAKKVSLSSVQYRLNKIKLQVAQILND